MQVSTKLFNDQQIRQFGKLTEDIQQNKKKYPLVKLFCGHQMILLQPLICLRLKNRNNF